MHPNIRGWIDVDNRSLQTNMRLGAVLAFVAGATNAGGFLAVGTYTSHMTGIVSAAADELALGNAALHLGGSLLLTWLGLQSAAWLWAGKY